MKRVVSILLMVLLVMGNMGVFALEDQPALFSDMGPDHWAYNAVKVMVEYGVLNGYGDGTFRPDQVVTRAEFAKIMVKALNLTINENATSPFIDVADDHWVVPYVDASKNYLTGYESTAGIKFKPDDSALREDMAVALVRALALDMTSTAILETYSDQGQISENLKPYVATAINNELIKGYVTDAGKTFKPLGELTRAEASQLLLNVIVEKKIVLPTEDKVVLDDDKNTTDKKAPILAVANYEEALKLKWTPTSVDGFKYYKIVASKSDSSPQYPDNGYAVYKDNVYEDDYKIYTGHKYNGGDVGTFKAGETYYFAITAVYHDGTKVTSNVVKKTMPGTVQAPVEKKAITLEVIARDHDLVLEWTPATADGFKYYKISASKSDSSPKYPDNGYGAYEDTVSDTRYEIYAGHWYNSGDFSEFKGGESYYFAITAVYHDGTKIVSNAVKKMVPFK